MFNILFFTIFSLAVSSVTALVASRDTAATTTTGPTLNSCCRTATDVDLDVDADGTVYEGGFATFYYQQGLAGSCGQVNQDSDLIVAIDYVKYGDMGSVSPLCGKKVEITNTNNQRKVNATITSACPICPNENSMDLSVAAFEVIAATSEGIVPITWRYL